MIDNSGSAKIYSFNQEGEGIAEWDDKTISIPFALPGEKVSFECLEYKKKKKYILTDVLQASAQRATPPCPHFTHCGGCTLQHLNTDIYKEFKKSLITTALESVGLDTFILNDLIVLPFGRRRRVDLEGIKKNDQMYLGFHRWRSRQIINLNECHTMAPELSKLLEPLRQAFDRILTNYQKVKVFLTLTEVGVDASVEVQGVVSLTEEQRQVLMKFAESAKVARLTFRHRKFMDTLHQTAEPFVMFGDVKVAVTPYSFLQATKEADTVLSDLVKDGIPESAQKVADLFCGRGTFSFPLSKVAEVDGYEFDKNALEALNAASSQSGLNIQTHYRNLFDEPLSVAELNAFDAVVVDPPRAGAAEQTQQLCKSRVKTIVYVSCNPKTFVRDAKDLVESGYKLEKLTAVDQFAWSPHLEVVGVFSKK